MDLLARTCNYDRMNLERILARGFVIFGGVFWVAAALGAATGYLNATPLETARMALIPLVVAVVAFVVGWFYERLAAIGLLVGAALVIVWGVVMRWEAGVWLTMTAFLIAEMVIAGLLFMLAARTERVCELEETRGA